MPSHFLMSYFTPASEALHLATSMDGEQWTPLAGGEAILRGTVGTRSLRDPFIGRGLDGRYHLLATDGWTSTSVVHASSLDLVHWSQQRLIPVMEGVEGAWNAWAPEFFVDADDGTHHVIWSSSVVDRDMAAADPDVVKTSTMEHRIWASSTHDFHRWSPPRVFFDPGYTVIDASVHRMGAAYLMAFKDERGDNGRGRDRKGIRVTTFPAPGAAFSAPSPLVTERPAEGPTLFRTPTGVVLLFDEFLDGTYGALISTDAVEWRRLDGFRAPPGARHAAVLDIPREDFLRLSHMNMARAGEKPPLAPRASDATTQSQKGTPE